MATSRGLARPVYSSPPNDDATNRLLVRVREMIDRNGLKHIDLGPALSGRMAALLDPATQHWTPGGQRVVADALAPAISELVKKARDAAPGTDAKPAGH